MDLTRDAFNKMLEGVNVGKLPKKQKNQPKRHKYFTKPIAKWLHGVANSIDKVDDDTDTYPFHPTKALLFLRDDKSGASMIETQNMTEQDKVFWLEVLKTEVINGTANEIDEEFGTDGD